MDEKVKEVQKWLNENYGDNSQFIKVEEDGITGNSTCKALIRVMQIELGLATVDGVWGNSTTSAYSSIGIKSSGTNFKNQIYIIQGGFYCKGINPGGLDGIFGESLESAVIKFESYAGLTKTTGIASAKVVKALLNTDAYTLLSEGDASIRTIQQALNNNYSDTIGLIPCDGVFSKTTCRGLITGLQLEQKKTYSATVVDGIWGTNTMNHCPTLQRYGTVANKQYVYLLQYALYINGFDPNGFDGGFGAGVQNAVKKFQTYMELDVDGIVGKRTWAALLVSYGDAERVCKAADCRNPLTAATAALLVADGKTGVGRYLTGSEDKCLTIEELRIIRDAGLKLFPIYQTSGNTASYFTKTRGLSDAYKAYKAYTNLCIADGGTIYFAVDYDVTLADIENNIIPYFEGIRDRLSKLENNKFKIGIYAPRYVCKKTNEAGITTSSFVCDMSSGFACNIGHSLPKDWAFDQIKNHTLSSDDSSLEIDNDYVSSRDASILVDPDNYTSTTNTVYEEYRVVDNILDCFGVDLNVWGLNFEYGVELLLASQPGLDIYAVIARSSIGIDSSVKISLSVVNGKISATNFVVQFANITSQMPFINGLLNLEDLAIAIDNGEIQIGLEVTTTKAIIEIMTVVYSNSKYNLTSNLSAGFKMEFSIDYNDFKKFLELSGQLAEETIQHVVLAYEQMMNELEKYAKQTVLDINSKDVAAVMLLIIMGIAVYAFSGSPLGMAIIAEWICKLATKI